MAKRKLTVSVKLDPDIIERIDRIADAERRTRSYIVGDLVLAGLEQRETAVKMYTDPTMMAAVAEFLSKGEVLSRIGEIVRKPLDEDTARAFESQMKDTVKGIEERRDRLRDARAKRRKPMKERKS